MTHSNRGMIGKSKEFGDVGRVASSFPTYLEKIEAILQAGYSIGKFYSLFTALVTT